MSRRLLLGSGILLWVLLVAAVVVAAADRLPYRGWEGASVTVTVPAGSPTDAIGRLLHEKGIVRSPLLFSVRARLTGRAGGLQAGEYRFEEALSAEQVLLRLFEGRVVLYPVTVPEGLNLFETAARLAAEGVADEVSLEEAFSDPSLLLDLDPRAGDLEGYLFPDTYSFPRGATALQVASAMVRRFREVLAETGWPGEEERPLRDVVTLASLVEEETGVPEERGLVAGVFAARLEKGWRLECDPTVRYALVREGLWPEERPLSRKDLAFDSPYNTYRVAGLPPGPICSPGRDALLAALDPAPTPALFFVARGDGSGRHEFSRTLQEHLRAVGRYRARVRASRGSGSGGSSR